MTNKIKRLISILLVTVLFLLTIQQHLQLEIRERSMIIR